MNLAIFNLVSYNDSDDFINGVHFDINLEQAQKLVSYFRRKGFWTEYYYTEIGDYTLESHEVEDVLELSVPFWMDRNEKYFFNIWSLTEDSLERRAFLNDMELSCIQSTYKLNNRESHFFLLKETTDEYLNRPLERNEIEAYGKEIYHFDYDYLNYKYWLRKIRAKDLICESDVSWLKFDN